MNQDGNSGSLIEMYLRRNEENVMTFKCEIRNPKDKKQCGKIYLRGEMRNEVARNLQNKTTYLYRNEKLDALMEVGDEFEPAVIPNASALRTAKSEVRHRALLDPDPLKAVHKMKLSIMKDVIYNIGLSPVFVFYSTKHQDTIYKTLADQGNVSVAIDATGSIVRKIRCPDKSESGPIFLYAMVVRTVTSSCSVAQMVSERHNTTTITHWLNEWICNTGASVPKEVVCDSSKALLAACVRSFTKFSTISSYADSLADDILPSCYIRIDVAHFIKKYADFLKGIRREVRKFYLSCIGRLIITEDIREATNICYALLVISSSDYDGPTISGTLSEAEKQKKIMMNLLTSGSDVSDPFCGTHDSDDDSSSIALNSNSREEENRWSNHGNELLKLALANIEKATGTRINPHRLKKFPDKLIEDLKFLPLWSCILRNKFGYGRVPASSAHVEAEFKKIKHQMLVNQSVPMRLDEFINLHIKYLGGVMKNFNVVMGGENLVTNKQLDI